MTFVTYPDEKEIVRNSGFLYWGPTSLLTESGYGTLLGYVDSLVFRPNMNVIPFIQEGSSCPTIFVYTGCAPELIANLYNYNNTALARLFPGMVTTGTKSAYFPTIYAGKNLQASYTGKLIYIPDNTSSDPTIYISVALPRIADSANLRQSHSEKTIFPCVFSGQNFYYGLLSGVTL